MSVRIVAVLTSVLSFAGCLGTKYRPRTEQPGVPAQPPTRLEYVIAGDQEMAPGIASRDIAGYPFVQPSVTGAGWEPGEEVEDSHRKGVSVAVRVKLPGPTEIAGMSWTIPETAPCASGHPALRMSVDDRVHWERPLIIEAEHVVTGRFDQDIVLLRRTSVVDLRLVERSGKGGKGGETCVRVPATGPDIVSLVPLPAGLFQFNPKSHSGGASQT